MEPQYEYVKGQGWILKLVQFREVTNLEGFKFRIELRHPDPGEFYRYTATPWDINQWENWFSFWNAMPTTLPSPNTGPPL